LREKLSGEAKVSAAVIVNMISSAVAISLDMLSAMCVPMVALMLAAVSKIGIEGWCSAINPNVDGNLQLNPAPPIDATEGGSAQPDNGT